MNGRRAAFLRALARRVGAWWATLPRLKRAEGVAAGVIGLG